MRSFVSRLSLFTAAFLAFSITAQAQNKEDIRSFCRDAGSNSTIYRNRQAIVYDFRYEGDCFWDSPEFSTGELSMEGKVYTDLKFNINAHTHNLVLMLPDSPLQIQIPERGLDWVSLGGRRLVNLKKQGVRGSNEGLYEELGEKVWLRVEKTLVDETKSSGDIVSVFKEKRLYFTLKGGELKRIGKKKAHSLCSSGTPQQEAMSGTAPTTGVRTFSSGQIPAQSVPEELLSIALPKDYFTEFAADTYSAKEESQQQEIDEDPGGGHLTREEVIALKGAAISADLMAKHRDSKMGVEKMQVSTITHVPVAFGEADVLKVVLTLPGVKSAGEASSGFNVRGGASDQNLILFGDCTIYNPNHMFGIFSAFDTDVVRDVELFKCSIPAKYGGRISSVLNVQDKDGNSEKIHGSVGLGLLTSRLNLEGPLGGKRTTFNIGGRITYSNWLMNFLEGRSNYSGGRAAFGDLTSSITHRFSDRNSLHAFVYWSRDNFSFSSDTSFTYRNLNASLKWKRLSDSGGRMELTCGFNSYGSNMDNSFNDYASYSFSTKIAEEFAKLDFRTPLGEHNTLSYGIAGTFHGVSPGSMAPLGELSLVGNTVLGRENAVEGALYVSDVWQPGYRFSLEGGLRYSAFSRVGNGQKFYCAPEFRLSAKYSLLPTLSAKAGFNSMNQYIHLISNTTCISPMDTWKLCNDRIRPQEGWQAAGGLYWTVIEKGLDLSLEGYYKASRYTLDYKPGAVLIMNPDLEDDLVQTRGKAWGIETMMKKSVGKLTGWVSYTWSRTFLKEMEDRGLETINGGDWYCAPYDKPHDFKLVGNYKFTQRYSISFNADYSTGRPVTIPTGTYSYGGGYRLYYSKRNAYRIPDYFRLDLAMNIEPSHYLKQLTHMSVTFGVYNVTGRKNAYSVYYTTDSGTNVKGHMLSVFAAPIPYINLNLKF